MTDLAFDLVIVGSGAAGLSAALRAADLGARVAVLTAGRLLAGSSPRAQGGVAAAVGVDDTPAQHAADTLRVGAGLNDTAAVDVLTRYARKSVSHLRDSGVGFADDLGLEAGHARRRILHAGGGATGQVLTHAFLSRAQANPRITLLENSPVTELTLRDDHVTGVLIAPTTSPYAEGWARPVTAPAVILATGGYAALWHRTTNAPETRGSGLLVAYHAGASLADLEFVQFHPTALRLEGAPALLLSEALRGEGARLIDEHDNELVDPLLPRDVLARAVHRHITEGRRVLLSLRHLDPEHVYVHFANLAMTLMATANLDLARDPLPIAPAAHYCMGGIRTDTWGRTDVPGLYAAGEVACSGAQGANRLASNSLLECLVFGARTAEAALSDCPKTVASWRTTPIQQQTITTPSENPIDADSLARRLDEDLGVERDSHHLTRLLADLAESGEGCLVALIARAALTRTESRGAHFRTDAPHTDSAWRGRIHWRRGHPPVFEEVSA